jgi:hypothetical protein
MFPAFPLFYPKRTTNLVPGLPFAFDHPRFPGNSQLTGRQVSIQLLNEEQASTPPTFPQQTLMMEKSRIWGITEA